MIDRLGEAHPDLPPGQQETHKFPVVGEKTPSPGALDLAGWRLHIEGLVVGQADRPLALTWADYMALPHTEFKVDIHCVTGWSRLGLHCVGLPLARLLDELGLTPQGRFVSFTAYSARRHDTSLPLDLALSDCHLVHAVDGRPLTVEHGFPLRSLVPGRYFYKSLKWLHRIEFLAEDRLGYWERTGSYYHNNGDPWAGDQRYDFTRYQQEMPATPAEIAHLCERRNLHELRKRIFLGLALPGWSPVATDLSGLNLKSCDLRGAQLSGRDLRGINLTHCDLRGADLSDSDLRGADLEGADLSGANLSNVDLRDCHLSATRFFTPSPEGPGIAHPARVAGLRWTPGSLLEDQEHFLRRGGA